MTAQSGTGPLFELTALGVSFGAQSLLRDLDLRVDEGAFLGILGPNGSGKTTLLRVLSGALRPSVGEARLGGRPLQTYRAADLALQVGVVPQAFSLDFAFTVREVVAMGTYLHKADFYRVSHAMAELRLESLADRSVTKLSGGERQRALIAQTLAQDTPVLLLDEPLNNLDLNHQLQVMELLARLHASGRTVVTVLHDMNMAAHYCQDLLFLREGRVVAGGAPEVTLTADLVRDVFGAAVTVHHQGAHPYVTPVWAEPGTAPSKRAEHLVGVAHSGGAGPCADTARSRAAAASMTVAASTITSPSMTTTTSTTAVTEPSPRVHVVAGGGAAVELIDALVALGFRPSVGVVSVFDSDYARALDHGLDTLSTPPFEPIPEEVAREHRALAAGASSIVLAPQVYGPGNLSNLELAADMLADGKRVIDVVEPPIGQRDLSGGRAAELDKRLLAGGAIAVRSAQEAVRLLTEG